MEFNQLIGERIRALRTRLEESGAQFGRRLEKDLGEPWSRQTVWEAENGKREFRAEELFALARAGNVTVQFFLTAPAKTKLRLKGGSTLTPSELIDLVRTPQPTKKTSEFIGKARRLLDAIDDDLRGTRGRIKELDEFLRHLEEAEK